MTLLDTLREHWVLILVLFTMVWGPLVCSIISHTRKYRKEVADLDENEEERLAELWKPTKPKPLPRACLECPIRCQGCGAPLWGEHVSNCEGEEDEQPRAHRALTQMDLEQHTSMVIRGCCSTCGAPPKATHAPSCGRNP